MDGTVLCFVWAMSTSSSSSSFVRSATIELDPFVREFSVQLFSLFYFFYDSFCISKGKRKKNNELRMKEFLF